MDPTKGHRQAGREGAVHPHQQPGTGRQSESHPAAPSGQEGRVWPRAWELGSWVGGTGPVGGRRQEDRRVSSGKPQPSICCERP